MVTGGGSVEVGGGEGTVVCLGSVVLGGGAVVRCGVVTVVGTVVGGGMIAVDGAAARSTAPTTTANVAAQATNTRPGVVADVRATDPSLSKSRALRQRIGGQRAGSASSPDAVRLAAQSIRKSVERSTRPVSRSRIDRAVEVVGTLDGHERHGDTGLLQRRREAFALGEGDVHVGRAVHQLERRARSARTHATGLAARATSLASPIGTPSSIDSRAAIPRSPVPPIESTSSGRAGRSDGADQHETPAMSSPTDEAERAHRRQMGAGGHAPQRHRDVGDSQLRRGAR